MLTFIKLLFLFTFSGLISKQDSDVKSRNFNPYRIFISIILVSSLVVSVASLRKLMHVSTFFSMHYPEVGEEFNQYFEDPNEYNKQKKKEEE